MWGVLVRVQWVGCCEVVREGETGRVGLRWGLTLPEVGEGQVPCPLASPPPW